MKVAIRGKNIEVTDALRAYIEKRLSKLTRYFDDELNAQAVLSVVKDKSTIELTCFVDKIVLRGVETNDDMYAAIDLVVDKIVRQIHKYKTRLAKRFKKQEAFHPETLATPVEEETIEVVKRKHFVVCPMDVEEAILQMNLIGHDFFMFFNAETESMNVVYRRHDGFYGLIEPELQ